MTERSLRALDPPACLPPLTAPCRLDADVAFIALILFAPPPPGLLAFLGAPTALESMRSIASSSRRGAGRSSVGCAHHRISPSYNWLSLLWPSEFDDRTLTALLPLEDESLSESPTSSNLASPVGVPLPKRFLASPGRRAAASAGLVDGVIVASPPPTSPSSLSLVLEGSGVSLTCPSE